MQAVQHDLAHETLPPYLAKLGLIGEPFLGAPSGHFFYVGTDSERRLDLMHHLAPYSPLLVIIGDPGSGKTALLQQFEARAKENWRIINIMSRTDMGRDDLISEMSEALGLSSRSQNDTESAYLVLIGQLRALRQITQVPMLLIDDAQDLTVSLLELILKLCSENDNGHILSVILFATPQLQSLWTRQTLMPLAARITHTFEISPYTEEETARYIRHRLRAAGASDDGPFDSVTVKKIHAASGGIPARINELAQQVLMDRNMVSNQQPAKTAKSVTSKTDQRRRVIVVAGVVIAVLLIAGPLRSVLFKSTPRPPTESQQVRSLPMPSPMEGTGEDHVVRADGIATTQTPKFPSPQTGEAASPSNPETVKTLPLPPQEESTVTEPVMSNLPPPGEESEQTASHPEVHPVETSPEVPHATIAKNDNNIQELTEVHHSGNWLQNQADGNYTLQLMAVKDESTARRFIEAHQLQDKAAYFPVKSTGQTLYAVVYGSYPQRSEAVRAAKDLPSSWDTPKPWIRSFKSIHSLKP